MTCEIKQSDLNFYGTSQYYMHWTQKIRYTDGIHFLNENGAAWLVDAVASYQGCPELRKDTFYQFWHLEVKPDKSAVLTCREDDGIPAAVIQQIPFTDFPFDIDIWVEAGVMLLSTEH